MTTGSTPAPAEQHSPQSGAHPSRQPEAQPHAQPSPRRTALHAEHARLGASFTDFGGWDMPLKYGSELAEHRAVRETAGLFDLSHMGEIRVEGPDAAVFLNTALVGNLAAAAVGRAKYSLICDESGGIIDDLITYRLAEERFLVVPNAGNAPVVAAELVERARGFEVRVSDVSAETSLIAVQGPAAVAILHEVVPAEQRDLVTRMPYYAADEATIMIHGGADHAGADAAPVDAPVDAPETARIDVLLARTGYTGEDGFELYVENARAAALWAALLAAGEAHGLVPAGLACRDSLRLEAGMPLYGNELSRATTPFEAGLGPVVSFKKAEQFVGRAALEAVAERGVDRVLVGLRGLGRRAGRAGYAVLTPEPDGPIAGGAAAADAPREVGRITSGQPSPTLGHPIALAYVAPEYAELGTLLDVDLRGKREPVEVVALPFYRRPS